MKSKIFCLLWIGILSATVGCLDIDLDENPPSILGPSTFYKTEGDFQAALAGTFRPIYGSGEGFDFDPPFIMTSGAEDIRSDADIFKDLNRLNANGEDFSIIRVWKRLYETISNANAIIGNAENAEGISQEKLDEIDGQAKFIRAFSYFFLTRWFGEVQLTNFNNQQDIENIPQASVNQIYDEIVSNLKDAETKLPASFSEPGRPTKGAAQALLAKVYLTMAGWPLEQTANYELARDKAKEVISSGVYSLLPNFSDLWKQETKFNEEHIFGFYGSIAQNAISAGHLHFATRHWGNNEGGWGDFYSEDRFFEAFPEGPRKEASFTSVFADGTTWQEAGVQPHIAKYRDSGNLIGWGGEDFTILLRYADVLLIYAEAANMAEGGPSNEALEAVNQVRRRAMGIDINTPDDSVDLPSGMSQSEFDEAVLAERNWELAFEFNRWFDLVRKRMVVEVNKKFHPNVSENNRWLPKPSAQLIPGMLEQNPGY